LNAPESADDFGNRLASIIPDHLISRVLASPGFEKGLYFTRVAGYDLWALGANLRIAA